MPRRSFFPLAFFGRKNSATCEAALRRSAGFAAVSCATANRRSVAKPAEEERALDLARKQIKERDEFEAFEQAAIDLIRLDRYERRAWSRQKRAIRAFMNLKLRRDTNRDIDPQLTKATEDADRHRAGQTRDLRSQRAAATTSYSINDCWLAERTQIYGSIVGTFRCRLFCAPQEPCRASLTGPVKKIAAPRSESKCKQSQFFQFLQLNGTEEPGGAKRQISCRRGTATLSRACGASATGLCFPELDCPSSL